MRKLFATCLLAAAVFACTAHKPGTAVVFYNLENLFDTIDDPDTNDDEFLPEGARCWTDDKYRQKLGNMSRVLADIAAHNDGFPAVIGVAEVENIGVMRDLAAQPALADGGYEIVHFDSPDARGIDCGFFYRPDLFRIEGSAAVKFAPAERPDLRTRDMVTMWGTLYGEPFCFIVTHWPSRLGGKEETAPLRMLAAAQCRRMADSVRMANPKVKVVIMGDMNDDATDDSIVEGLGCAARPEELDGERRMFNPFIEILKSGRGTLAYRDSWNLFDNIIVSDNMAGEGSRGLKIERAADSEFYGHIFCEPYMVQSEGRYRGYPLRTFIGTNFMNGFSDHFPVYIRISK